MKNEIPEVSKNAQGFFDLIANGMNVDNCDDYDLLIKKFKITDEELIKFLKDANYGTKDLANYQKYLQETSKTTSSFSGFTSKAGTVLKSFGAALGSMAINWAIGEIIGLAIQGFDSLIHSAENAKKATEGFVDSYNNLQSEFKSNTTAISDLQDQYTKLSKGVDSLGKNVSLTNDEYSSYKDIISQISDIMPDLAVRYNEQGEKIGFVKGKLEDLNAEYDKYKKKQAIKMISEGDEEGNTLKDAIKNYRNQGKITDGVISEPDTNHERIVVLQKQINSGKFSNDEIEERQAQIQKYQSEIDNAVAGIQDSLSLLAQSNDEYYSLTDEQQNYIDTFLGNVTDEFIQANNLDTENGMRKFVNTLIEDIKSNKDAVTNAYNQLFSFDFDNSDLTPEEIQKKVNELVKIIADALHVKDTEQLKISLGFEFVDDNVEEYQRTLHKFKNKTFKDFSANPNRDAEIDDLANKNHVTQEELEKLAERGYDASTSIDTLKNALKEVRNELEHTGQSAKKVTFSSEADSLKTLADEISNVQTAYNEFKESGFSNIDTLGGIAEGFKDLDSYKKFVKVAGDAKSSANDIQKSFNNLVTEYIYTKGAIDNLTSSTVGLCETQLKAQGITNAHEIVTSDYAQAIIFANENGINLTNTTWEEISALAQQQGVTENVRQALGLMAIEKWKASNTGITNLQDLSYLEQIAISAGIAIEELQGFANAKAALNGDIPGMPSEDAGSYATQQANSEIEKIKAKYADYKPKANYSAPKTSNKNSSNKDKNKSKKDTDTKQEIDWIARKLERLQKVIDGTKAKFENLFKLKSKSNNLKKQIAQTETLLKAEEKAADKYAKKAKSYANSTKYTSGKNKGKRILSDSFIKQIQEGKINGSVKDLIKEYGSEKANAIQKYQDYWDKYKDAKQKVEELTTSVRQLREEQYQLYVDDAQAKIDKSNAWMELDSGNYKEQNKHLETQKKYLKQSYDYQIEIAKLNKDKTKESQLKAEYEQELRGIESQKFENIKNQYENEQSLMQAQEDSISRQIELIQTRGDMLDQSKYKDQIAIEQQKISSYKAEQSLLENQLRNITAGTDEWYEANSALESVKANIDDANKSISEMVKNINQIGETLRTKITDSFERVKTESDWIAELMSEIEDFDDQTHTVTNEGITRLGSYMTGMTVSEYQAGLMQEWIKELSNNKDGNGEAHFTSAITGTEINYTAEEFENAWKDAYDKLRTYDSEYMDYKNKAIEWEISKLNAQLSIMQDIVQSRKDALSAEKDLHDYQKSIQDSTQNIGSLQKQIAASIGDTSEEGIARTQKLQKELSDAQNDLKETEYDRYISDQEELLDKMMEEYEDLINSESKQREVLFNKAIQDADNNAKTITDTNIKYADDLGYKFETGIYKIGNVNDTISTTVGSILTELRNGIVVSNLPQANDSQSGQGTTSTTGSTDSTNSPTTVQNSNSNTQDQSTITMKNVQNAILENGGTSNLSSTIAKVSPMTKNNFTNEIQIIKGALKSLADAGIISSGSSINITNGKWGSDFEKAIAAYKKEIMKQKKPDTSKVASEMITSLSNTIKTYGFSKGGMVSELQKVATANGDEAWTTVKRGEDILTPLQSKVFNEEFIPRMDLMMDSAKVLDNIVKNSSFVGNVRNQSPINVEQNITLDLKEVNDPKTLVRFVQTDPTFKKVLSSVTIDQLGNSSRLDVNKYR